MLQWTWRRYLFQTVISFFSNTQDSNCGSYGSSIFNFFWGNSILFSIAAAQISLPTSSTQGFSFLHIFPMLVQFSSVFATSWTAACQASLSITNSRNSLKLMSIESVMPSSHLILCHPLLLLPPTPPSIKVFSNESTLHMRCPKYWSFSLSISPSKEHPGLISFRMDWLDHFEV